MTVQEAGRSEKAFLPPQAIWPNRVRWWGAADRYPKKMNATAALLDRQIESGRGDSNAFVYDGGTLSFADVVAESNRLGNGLARLGVRRGDRVLIQSLNEIEAVIANYAVLRIGAVVVPLSPLMGSADLRRVIDDCEPRIGFVTSFLREGMSAAAVESSSPGIRTVVLDGPLNVSVAHRDWLHYSEVVAGEEPSCPTCLRDALDVSVLFYTSGVDGPVHALAHVLEEMLIIPDNYGDRCWSVTDADVILGTAPISVAGGYSTILTVPSRFGAAAAVMPLGQATPTGVFAFVRRHRVTIMASIPTLYKQMLDEVQADPTDLATLRMAAAGGEPVSLDLLAGWRDRFGLPIFEGYGTNGMMHVFISNAVARCPKPGSMGLPLTGYQVELRDEWGTPVGPGGIGRLFVKGPVGTLHWGNPADAEDVAKRQAAAIQDGWVRVGDWLSQDELGYLRFVARDEELIRRSGAAAGPTQIEDSLVQHPEVQGAGVFESDGEIVALVVVGGSAGRDVRPSLALELMTLVTEHLGQPFAPARLLRVEQIPSTPFGTRLRRVTWQTWLEDHVSTEL